MIPEANPAGRLPPGIHWASWEEIVARFGKSQRRRVQMAGLRAGLEVLRAAGCTTAYLDGSFVTVKRRPGDFDVCWATAGVNLKLLDPVLLDFSNARAAQKSRYHGESFPAQSIELSTGLAFLEFFQIDKDVGDAKGIIAIDLRGMPSD
jgi:hypothetical protein